MAPEQSSQTEPVSPLPSTSSPASQPQPQQPSLIQQARNTNAHPQPPYNLYAQSYGQPYVPYQQALPQQQAPAQPMHTQQTPNGPVTYLAIPETFRRPAESNSVKIGRDILHIIVLILCAIGIGLSFSLLTGSPDGFGSYANLELPAMAGGPVFIAAFVWSFTELVVRFLRSWKAGIHPGAHVGVCLCLWLGAVLVGACLSLIARDDNGDYFDCVNGARYSYRTCARTKGPLFVGSTVLVLLVAAVEIILFIAACVDTHARNKWKRSIVIASTPYWAPPPQGFHVVPMQQQQSQFVPMGQPPMMQAAAQQPVVAPTRAPAHESQPVNGGQGNGTAPAQPEHGVKEFYNPRGSSVV